MGTQLGIDLIAFKFSGGISLEFNQEDIIGVKSNADLGWLENKIGVGTKLPIGSKGSARLYGYHEGVLNGIRKYDEVGVHIKMGVVYAVIIVAAFLWMALMGMNDVQTVFPELQKYFNSFGGCS